MGLFLESVTCVDLAITYYNKSNIVASIGSIWNLAAEVSQPWDFAFIKWLLTELDLLPGPAKGWNRL